MPRKSRKKKDRKISLYPLSTEEALGAVLSGKPGELGRKLGEARKKKS